MDSGSDSDSVRMASAVTGAADHAGAADAVVSAVSDAVGLGDSSTI